MIKMYLYNKGRNKCNLPNKSVNYLKNKLIESHGLQCYLCGDLFNKSQLELEHIIPIEIGGKIFCLSNLNLSCIKCHSKKTIIDKKVICLIKKIGYCFMNYSFCPLNELRELYQELFPKVKLNIEKYNKWFNGSSGVDYEIVKDNSNREVDDDS